MQSIWGVIRLFVVTKQKKKMVDGYIVRLTESTDRLTESTVRLTPSSLSYYFLSNEFRNLICFSFHNSKLLISRCPESRRNRPKTIRLVSNRLETNRLETNRSLETDRPEKDGKLRTADEPCRTTKTTWTRGILR